MVLVPRTLADRLLNGTLTGKVGLVHRGQADIAIGHYAISERTKSHCDFTYPFHVDAMTFVAWKLKKAPELMTILHPFSLEVWFALLLSTAAIFLGFYAFQTKRRFAKVLISAFASLLRQSPNTKNQSKDCCRLLEFLE